MSKKKKTDFFNATRMEYAGTVTIDQGEVDAEAGDYVCTLKEGEVTRNWLMKEGDFFRVMEEISLRGHGGRGMGLMYQRWLEIQSRAKRKKIEKRS